jgi:thermitase
VKPHVVVKVREGFRERRAPAWGPFIRDKSAVVSSLEPRFDRLLSRAGIPFWVTQEHAPASPRGWSREEIEAGLNRLYRVILRGGYAVPEQLVEQARLITDFETVRRSSIESAVLPRSESTSLAAHTLDASDGSRELIGLSRARLFGRGNPDVRVAILDTGTSLRHPELPRPIASADFVDFEGLDTTGFIGDFLGRDPVAEDEVGHGSHVAGIVAGAGKNMPAGIAPRCSLLAVRVLATLRDGAELVGAGVPDNIDAGIKWAIDRGAAVINMSLGIRRAGGGLPHDEVIRYAQAKNVTVVAASGNDGTEEKYYPGALPGVIAVGATDRDGRLAPFTSYGAPVWMLAPGTDIVSAYAGIRYARASGTSQAAPFVTGAVALLRSIALEAGVRLRDADIKQILQHTSDRPDRRSRTNRTGCGVLNLADACRLLSYRLRGRRAA